MSNGLKFQISQRGITAAIVFIIGLGIAAIAVANGYRLPPLRSVSVEEVLKFFLPLTGVILILNAWYDVLDAKVADGTLAAGDIRALFRMSSFYATIVSCAAGIYQFFGGQMIAPDTQVVIVDLLMAIVWFLLRSFSDRLPTDPVATTQKTYQPYNSSRASV